MSTCLKAKQKNFDFVDNGQHHDDEIRFKSINLNQQNGSNKIVGHKNVWPNYNQKLEGFRQTDMKMNDKSWNRKFSKDSKMPNFAVVEKDGDKLLKAENEWKSSKTKNNNGNTLLLHISAFENSVEAENKQKCKNDAKKLKSKTIAESFQFGLMNPFEIPRQQDNEKAKTPEVAEYHASQQLEDGFKLVNYMKPKARNLET
uniref:Uncharacterized protein n=1 Tax=Panagrolaimus sp. PS1159 TaxID=55785 RepID=A0AC35FZ40_9BILA